MNSEPQNHKTTGVRQSAEASNIFFVSPEPGSTLQSIGLQQWSMPWLTEGVPLYSVQRVLGYGSYSQVCLAVDNRLASQGHSNPLVALKRVPNVLADHRQAKLVLREIAVLRRIRHPNVLQLRSAFLQPSSVGQCRLIGGKLVHTAVDLYIATEYAEGGDLYSLKGNLSEGQVSGILWNMLDGLRYLHSCGIWHRDIKSQNAFLFREQSEQGGLMWRVKLGDFGSSVWRGSERDGVLRRGLSVDASSEDDEGDKVADGKEMGGVESDGEKKEGVDERPGCGRGHQRDDSLQAMKYDSDSYSDASVREDVNGDGNNGNDGNDASRQRRGMHAGRPSHPDHPINHRGTHHGTHAHQHLLTRQVCTPCYRAPEVVMSRGKYTDAVDMWGIGCIFGELLSRVSYVGTTCNSKLRVAPLFAVRDFPSVTPLPGETFTNTKKELDALFKVIGTPSWRDIDQVEMIEWRTYLETLPARAPTLMRRFKHAGEVSIHLLSRLLEFDPASRLTCEEAMQHEYFEAIREQALGCLDDCVTDSADAVDLVEEMSVEELSPAVERKLSVRETSRSHTVSARPPMRTPIPISSATSMRDEDGLTIGKALEKLEEDLDEILNEEDAAENRQDFFSPKTQRLLAMLTKECEAVTAHSSLYQPQTNISGQPNLRTATPLGRNKDISANKKASKTSLVEDVIMDDSEYARGRMSNVRDTWAGNELDASKFLKANRHGEWSEWSSERAGDGRRATPAPGWGVSVDIGGSAEYAAAIRQQQMK